jgi:hypothetical protein
MDVGVTTEITRLQFGRTYRLAVGRNHGYGAVVTGSQKGTGRQKNFRFTNLSIQRLSGFRVFIRQRLSLESDRRLWDDPRPVPEGNQHGVRR